MKAFAFSMLASVPAALGAWTSAEGRSIEYTSVPGYFMQDDNATDPSSFDYVRTTPFSTRINCFIFSVPSNLPCYFRVRPR